MGHARASYLMQSLIEVLKDLDYANKMVQVSMDGPNANWFLLDNLSIHQKEENANTPDLINIESYVHDSFGTALRKTAWNLKEPLKSFYKNPDTKTLMLCCPSF